MVERLKGAMGDIVHPDQNCGVPGLRVVDSLALIRDAIQYIANQNICAALVHLNQKEAFDHVSHEFMERVLQSFGLGERFCNYAAAKSWNECLAKVKQKLGLWSMNIEGKALVLRDDALPVLQYVTQAWPLLGNVARL
ncbi:hypothetical protein NDU88_006360 [Pleurodeles waltl]|uniref:Reverse transcriptase domain-containing protein n=1 Tax=Pleurodeles waltl TaxID=8319 RepID=A0AAV7MD26_PLEWA|nr:hypothetical protein NDU88_006360 [Pleurodeles waltl]